jgi:hypothetical protein
MRIFPSVGNVCLSWALRDQFWLVPSSATLATTLSLDQGGYRSMLLGSLLTGLQIRQLWTKTWQLAFREILASGVAGGF